MVAAGGIRAAVTTRQAWTSFTVVECPSDSRYPQSGLLRLDDGRVEEGTMWRGFGGTGGSDGARIRPSGDNGCGEASRVNRYQPRESRQMRFSATRKYKNIGGGIDD